MSDVPGGPIPPPPPPPPGTPPGPGGFRPRTLGEILSEAFRIYRENAANLLVIVAVVVVPLSLIGAVAIRLFDVTLALVFIGAAIGVIISFILQAAMLRGAAQATIGDPVDVEASYRWGLSRLGSVLLVANLVRGHFWHALVVILVAAIITWVIQGILGAIGGDNWFVRWIFSAIAQIITAPFTALVTVLLYLDLRARTEALTADRLRTELASSM